MAHALANRVAIVTGGGSGIGLASARRLAMDGATAVIFGPDAEMLSGATEQLQREGWSARSVEGDVSSSESVSALIESVSKDLGRIDFVVNSAAIQPYGTVETTSEQDWDRVLAVNLKGIYLTSRYVVPVMRRQGGGAIVNVASVQGIACQTRVAAYVASKGGVLALTRAMALDHAKDGIRVNAVCPGSVDTPALRADAAANRGAESEDETIAKWGRAHPLGRVGRAEEIAEVIAFLCSEQASFCTGGEFKVDGGLLAKLAAELPDW